MRRFLLFFVVSAVALSCASCRRAAERAREKIRLEAVEQVAPRGLSGVDVTLRVANGSGHRLVLESAEFDLYYAGSRAGGVTLREAVEVPKRTTLSAETRWRLRIADPLACFALVRRLRAGDPSRICVSYDVRGHGGPVPVHLAEEMVPLSQFLRTFGLSIEDLKNYLG